MILKLLVFLTTTEIIRCESILTESTSKPSIPKDLQELLDSLYMNGFIPEYILPEDELTETEKTEGEYLDFPELKNAQDDVFVPPESEYSKNSLHYKNIKPRKRLIQDRHRKIKISNLQRDILQPGISPEELRSNLIANLAENLTGKVQKYNSSVKLDFLLPIPERGNYPYNSPTELYDLNQPSGNNISSRATESYKPQPTELGNPTQHVNSIPTEPMGYYKAEPTEFYISEKFEGINLELTQPGKPIPTDLYKSRQTESFKLQPAENDSISIRLGNMQQTTPCNSRTTESFTTEPSRSVDSAQTEICNNLTELCNTGPTENLKKETTELCDDLLDKKRITSQWPMNIPNIEVLFEVPRPSVCANSNAQQSMKLSSTLKPKNEANTPMFLSQGYMNNPTSQGPMRILKPQGPMNVSNPQGFMKLPYTKGTMNSPNPFQKFMNWSNINKEVTEYTTMKQFLLSIPEYATKLKYQELKSNATMPQPYTFEIVSPKSEKDTKTLQTAIAMLFQRNVTIKPAHGQQIKSMLNIQLGLKQFPQFTANTKQPENGLRSPAPDKQAASNTVALKVNGPVQAQKEHTIRPGIGTSTKRLVLKIVDKNIATNVVSLMADPSSISKRDEAEGMKPFIKPSFSVNNEITSNVEPYFDQQSNNLSEIIKPSSQNAKNKERKNINQNYISKENVEAGKPKKKMFTFLNIFKKNKKYPPPEVPGRNSTTDVKREVIKKYSNELYRQLLENNAMNDYYDVESQYPIKQELEEETFNHKRKKK